MVMGKPVPMQPVSGDPSIIYSARELRAGMVAPLFSREGVRDLRGGELRVTQRSEGANFSVDIATGYCAIFGDDTSEQGTYVQAVTSKENRSVPTASSSVTRNHRVIAQIRDKLENSAWPSGTYDWQIIVQADTAETATMPPSAIPLAQIAVPANAGSITNSMIKDLRKRWSVGTSQVEVDFGAIYSGFTASDATRPLKAVVNPDGWVQLSGWVRWNEPNTTVPAGEQRTMGGTPLADSAVRPPGIRDFPGTSVFGPVHFAVFPNGALYFRFQQAVTLTTSSWFSFDGCFYRI